MERIKKLIVVILCVGMISSLNISFIYASQSNGYHPLNIKIESPDVPKTVTPKRNARSLDSYYSSSELGQVTSVKDQGNTELCWAFGITSMGETSLIKQGIASTNIDFSEKHFGYFMYNRKNDILNNTKGDKTKVSGDWRYAGGNSLLAMLSLTGWYGLAKENIAPFNTGKWRLSDSVGQKDSAILKNGFFLGDTPQAAVVKSYIIGYGSVVMAYHAPKRHGKKQPITERIMRHTTAIVPDRQQIILLRSLDGMIVIAEIILTVDPDRPEMEHGS